MTDTTKDKNVSRFIWDPEKERNFNSPPSSAGQTEHLPFNFSGEAAAAAETIASSRPFSVQRKKPNLLDILLKRQTGCLLSHVFERDVLKHRVTSLRKIREDPSFRFLVDKKASLSFLRTGVNSVYAIWNSGTDRSPMTVGEMRHEFGCSSHLCLNVVADHYNLNIEDVCDGWNDLVGVFFIANTTHEIDNFRSFVCVHRRLSDLGDRNTEIYSIRFKYTIQSFSGNKQTSTVAIGLDDRIAFVSLEDGFRQWEVKNFDSEVLTQQFNKDGSLLYSGHYNGMVVAHDIRDSMVTYRLRMSSYAVGEMVLLSNENYILCGDVKGRLLKIDLRMKATAVEYYGHRRSVQKNPISISEDHHLLCATGIDQITRLWSLSDGGEPLHSFVTPGIINKSPYHSVLVSNSSKCLIYQAQQNRVFISE